MSENLPGPSGVAEGGSTPEPRGAEKTCPCCGQVFVCRAGDPAHCGCSRVVLGPETLAGLRARFRDCLCPACLAAFAREPSLPR